MKRLIVFLMSLMMGFNISSIKSKPTNNQEEAITFSTQNLLRANNFDEYDFDWNPDENQIEELESPESFDDIFASLDMVTETLANIDEQGELYDCALDAINTFRTYVEEGVEKETISENYLKDAFETILQTYEEEEENDNTRARSSSGVTSFNIYWEAKKFFWFTVKLPVGFEIKLSANACRKIISVGSGVTLDAIITILQAQNFGPKLAVTISLLASLTGNVVLVAAAGVLVTLATNAVVHFVVKSLLSYAFSYMVDKILNHYVTGGIIIYTYGTTPIRFSYQ